MIGFRKTHVSPRPGRVLVVGSRVIANDWRERFPNGLGVDLIDGPGVHIRHDMEMPLDGVAPFDHVECLSVLEHCRRPWLVAQNVEALMTEGATLYLSVPFVWRWHGYPGDYWRFTHQAVELLFPAIKWQALRYVDHFAGEMFEPTKVRKGKEMPRVLPRVTCHPHHLARMEVHGFGVRL